MKVGPKSIHLSTNHKLVIGGGTMILLLLVFQWYELALGVLSTVPLILLFRLSLLDGSLETRFLSISYLGGQSLCWLVGFLGCIYIFPLIDYPLVYLFTNVS